MSRKTFRMLSAGATYFALRKFCFWQITMYRDQAIAWQGKTTTLHVHHAFLYISLPSLHDYQVKMPNFTFCEGRKQAMKNFFLFVNLDMFDRNSAPEEFACIWQSKWVGIITIETEKMWVHSSCEYFVVISSRDIQNSLRFTKAWSMQAWIPCLRASSPIWASEMSLAPEAPRSPSLARSREARLACPNRRACSRASEYLPVVSSSLYFWKSVFSFRVDSGCLYTRLASKTWELVSFT